MHWILRVEGGPERVNHAAATFRESIYMFGGYCTKIDYSQPDPIDVHIFNTVTLKWTAVPYMFDKSVQIMPFRRYGHTVISHNHLIYMWGGRNDVRACNVLYCYNTMTDTWSQPQVTGRIPGARDGHSCCVIQDKMFVFGGYEEILDRFSQDVYCLNLNTMEWRYIETRGCPPRWRDFHTASAIGDHMYVLGGRSSVGSVYHTEEELYDPSTSYLDTTTMEWCTPQVNGFIPVGRRSHSAFVLGGKLFIFGGYNRILNKHFNDLNCYDPVTRTWTAVVTRGVTMPCPRRRQCCCLVKNRVYIFGGTSPKNHYQQNVAHPLYERVNLLRDHSDMYVLDLFPSLKTLAAMKVKQYKLEISHLPKVLVEEVNMMASEDEDESVS